jgi:acyl-CoA hydrolase
MSISTEQTAREILAEHVHDGADLVAGLANGGPPALLDALDELAAEGRFEDVTVHQMHPLERRPYMTGAYGERLRHVSYFLAAADRGLVRRGVEYVPTNFSEVPRVIQRRTRDPLVLAQVGRDEQGDLAWGTSAEYCAALVRDGAPLVAEVNARMPVAGGTPRIPERCVLAAIEVDRPLHSQEPPLPLEPDRVIASLVAERIPQHATLQIGIGAIPDLVLVELAGHRGLRIHTELLTDGIATLATTDAVANHPDDPALGTFALGSDVLHEWLDGNPAVALRPVDEVNDPLVVARQPRVQSIVATTEIDLYGQCASETVGGRYYSGSGGQLDFMRGVHRAPDGQGFVVCRSRLRDGSSRISSVLSPGSVVTTGVHFVDMVVTEHGVAELRDRSLTERARALIAIAAPEHRDALTDDALARGLL